MDFEQLYLELEESINQCLESDLTPLPFEQLLEFYKAIRTAHADEYLIYVDKLTDLILTRFHKNYANIKKMLPITYMEDKVYG